MARSVPRKMRTRGGVVAEKASRRGRLYSIGGVDSPVTGAAIRVNVAGGVRDRLSPVRRARRRLAPARKPRHGDPRAPAAARRAQARQAPAAASPDRPRLLGGRLPRVVAMGGRARDRQAGDRDRVAPPRLRSFLGLEVEARRTTAARAGDCCAHCANGSREPAREPSPVAKELAKLGHDVGKDAVAKYMPRPVGRTPRPPSQTWGTFIRTHAVGTIAIDFFTVPTVTFGVLYVFFVLSLERRRVIHVNVTENPTAEWAAQQIVEAVGPDVGLARLIRDRDKIFGAAFDRRVDNLGLTQLRIAPRSPWQNGFAERWVGTARREIFDHMNRVRRAPPEADPPRVRWVLQRRSPAHIARRRHPMRRMSSRLRWDASSRSRGSADSIIATGGSRREARFLPPQVSAAEAALSSGGRSSPTLRAGLPAGPKQ